MERERRKVLNLTATPDTIATVLESLEAFLDEGDCPMSVKTAIMISVEEIYVNIVRYAYGGKEGEAIVQMEVTPDPEVCRITFRDRGTPYDPLAKEDPDITLSAEERSVGGLGIFMTKKCMDRVEYAYEDGYNVLTMEKKIA